MQTGALMDEDIELLHRVLHERCKELGIVPDSQVGQQLAAQMISLYKRGIRDEKDLKRHFLQVR